MIATCCLCRRILPRDRCPVPGCEYAARDRRISQGEAGRSNQDARSIADATGFEVKRFMGRGLYEDHGIYLSLQEAVEAKEKAGRDEYGRPCMIYALAPGRAALFVE
jgi:hypothetical protein